jgi:hypothetical protein
MALRTNKVVKPETVADEPEIKTEEVMTEKTAETPVTTTEVAVKTQAAPPAVAKGEVPSITSLADAWPPEDFGNVFPRIRASSGSLMNEKTSFGEYIDVQVLSHSPRWFVTPDSKPGDDEASKLCRASYDGKTITDRETGESIAIEDYIASVPNYEFKVGKYHDLYCLIFNSAKNKDAATELNIVQVSVSPTSVKGFTAFMMQTKLSVMRGQMLASHQNCMRIFAEAVSNKKGDYTMMKFGATPLDVLADFTPVVE